MTAKNRTSSHPIVGCSSAATAETLGIEPAMTYQEIAQVLGISRQAVYELERRALAKLRRRLHVKVPEDQPESELT